MQYQHQPAHQPCSATVQSLLVAGELTDLLHYLRTTRVLTHNDVPRTIAERQKVVRQTLHTALKTLYTLTLPIALLSNHLPPTSPFLLRLPTLRANLHLLPALGAAPQPLAPIAHSLSVHHAPQVDAASMLLAQVIAWQSTTLLDVWNAVSPTPSLIADDIAHLPERILSLVQHTHTLHAETVALDVHLAQTRRATLRVLQAAADAAVTATDIDTAERAQPMAATQAEVALLAARGLATAAKMRLVGGRVRRLLYDEETVIALRMLGAEIERRKELVAQRLERASKRLARYRQLGRGFETVVEQYVAVKSKLDQLVWSKQQLALG